MEELLTESSHGERRGEGSAEREKGAAESGGRGLGVSERNNGGKEGQQRGGKWIVNKSKGMAAERSNGQRGQQSGARGRRDRGRGTCMREREVTKGGEKESERGRWCPERQSRGGRGRGC